MIFSLLNFRINIFCSSDIMTDYSRKWHRTVLITLEAAEDAQRAGLLCRQHKTLTSSGEMISHAAARGSLKNNMQICFLNHGGGLMNSPASSCYMLILASHFMVKVISHL